MAFSAFDLEHSNKAKPEERLQRLSQVFEVDFDQLAQEFWDLRPLAMHEFSKGCTCCQAWVRTVQRIEASSGETAASNCNHPPNSASLLEGENSILVLFAFGCEQFCLLLALFAQQTFC